MPPDEMWNMILPTVQNKPMAVAQATLLSVYSEDVAVNVWSLLDSTENQPLSHKDFQSGYHWSIYA